MLKLMLVNHKFLTVKHLLSKQVLKVSSFVNLVVKVNMVTYGSNLHHLKKGKDSNLKMPLLVVLFLVNLSLLLNKD